MTENKIKNVTKKKIATEVKAQLSSEEAFYVKTYQYDKLASMRNGVHSCVECEFDGITIPLRLLSTKEIHELNMEIKRDLNSFPPEVKYPGIDIHLYTRKLLAKATTPSPAPTSLPILSESDIDNLTPDQVGALFQIWTDFNKECSPVLDNLTAEEIDNLYGELKKNPVAVNSFTPFQLRNIVLYQRNLIMSLTDS